MKRFTTAILGFLLIGLGHTVVAQTYPARPIRIVVPFPAGGIADLFARVIGQKFNEAWGQPVVVDNRPGAGGNIGAEIVAKSPADGYTLVMGSIGTHSVNVSLFSKLAYDPIRDFAPVALVMEAEGLLVLHPSVPVKTVKELIALAKARPGQVAYASAGYGTAGHLSGELFKSMAKVDMVHVPYKGNVPAITDLIAGQTSLLFATMPTVLPQFRPLAGCAGTADHRGSRAAGLLGHELDRYLCASRDVARHREQAQWRDHSHHAGARYPEAARQRRREIHA
jgi:tripartite-type tricarboxylate transporter receptor subunit TctC